MQFLRNEEMKKTLLLLIITTIVALGIANEIGKGTVLLLLVVVFAYNFIFFKATKKRYEELSSLIEEIDKILNSDELVILSDIREGDFAIVKNEIRKMTIKIREGEERLKKEKIHLTDSIADISHQLRTPLTTITLLMAKMRRKETSEEEKKKCIIEINTQLERIDWLISSLLKISKIDADTVKLKMEEIRVADVINEAIKPLMIPFEIREQLFDFSSYGNEKYIGDINWSAEAVGNIIKNCMEHTPQGGYIRVVAKENVLFTAIEITDSGSGIDKQDLSHIFERFYRGKNSSIASVGIGLALSKMIIQLQNGTIKAENIKSGGSKFTIKFYKGDIDGNIAS